MKSQTSSHIGLEGPIPQQNSSRPSATLPSPTSEIIDTRTTPVGQPTTGPAIAVTSEVCRMKST